MTGIATHRQKKSKQCLEKSNRYANSALLHGVEWDRLIVHRTHMSEIEIKEPKNTRICKPSNSIIISCRFPSFHIFVL